MGPTFLEIVLTVYDEGLLPPNFHRTLTAGGFNERFRNALNVRTRGGGGARAADEGR